MASLEWQVKTAERIMRQLRIEDKESENLKKPPLQSNDVRYLASGSFLASYRTADMIERNRAFRILICLMTIQSRWIRI